MHHVTARSNAEEHIFKDTGDFVTGVTLLGKFVAEGHAVCHAFCFMPTHYHLLGTFENATKFVHAFDRAVAFNRRYKRRGHVFDSPPSLTPIESESHLRRVMRYIALNPPEPERWPYASYPGLIGVSPPFAFVDPSATLELIGSVDDFRRYVDEGREAKDLNQVAGGNLVLP